MERGGERGPGGSTEAPGGLFTADPITQERMGARTPGDHYRSGLT